MTPMGPGLAQIGAFLALLAAPVTASKPSELTAILIQIEGQVTLSHESRETFKPVRLAAQRQIIRHGERVHVPAGGQVTAVCSTEKLVRLTGPQEWDLDTKACGGGVTLPESSYRNLASYGGRILPKHGTLMLELEPRNGDVGPMLLSPRHTALLDPRPLLVWTRVPEASEYEIKLRGPVDISIRLPADRLSCGLGLHRWHDLDVCSWTPSGSWPGLKPEKQASLELGYRRDSSALLLPLPGTSLIHLVSVEDRDRIRLELERITALSLDPVHQLLLAAGAYARSGLLADAIAAYEDALQAQDFPEARVVLGDLYLTVGLTVLADREYRRAVAGSLPTAARAAAELGLGYASYFRKRFANACQHFARAHELYLEIGMAAEAEDARAAGARC